MVGSSVPGLRNFTASLSTHLCCTPAAVVISIMQKSGIKSVGISVAGIKGFQSGL